VIDEGTWRLAMALRSEHPDVLADPRAVTRLLCGVSSPRLARAKLTADPLFGALGHVPFGAVLRRAEG
jgi:ATP-dependent DNA helicase RecQ